MASRWVTTQRFAALNQCPAYTAEPTITPSNPASGSWSSSTSATSISKPRSASRSPMVSATSRVAPCFDPAKISNLMGEPPSTVSVAPGPRSD